MRCVSSAVYASKRYKRKRISLIFFFAVKWNHKTIFIKHIISSKMQNIWEMNRTINNWDVWGNGLNKALNHWQHLCTPITWYIHWSFGYFFYIYLCLCVCIFDCMTWNFTFLLYFNCRKKMLFDLFACVNMKINAFQFYLLLLSMSCHSYSFSLMK